MQFQRRIPAQTGLAGPLKLRDPPDHGVWGAGFFSWIWVSLDRVWGAGFLPSPSNYVIRRIMGFGGLEEKLARLRFDQLYVFSVGGLGFFLAPQTT